MNCPYCGAKFDYHEDVASIIRNDKPVNTVFKDGDVTVCIKCIEVGVYKGNTIEKTDEATLPVEVKKQVEHLRQAWLKVERDRKAGLWN